MFDRMTQPERIFHPTFHSHSTWNWTVRLHKKNVVYEIFQWGPPKLNWLSIWLISTLKICYNSENWDFLPLRFQQKDRSNADSWYLCNLSHCRLSETFPLHRSHVCSKWSLAILNLWVNLLHEYRSLDIVLLHLLPAKST